MVTDNEVLKEEIVKLLYKKPIKTFKMDDIQMKWGKCFITSLHRVSAAEKLSHFFVRYLTSL